MTEAVENASAVYGDISDITSFYIGRGKQECKMAVPLDYTLAGASQIVDGEEESVFPYRCYMEGSGWNRGNEPCGCCGK